MTNRQPLTSKYAPLEQALRAYPADDAPMSFADVERLIGAPLPPSARRHRAWWSNNPSNSVITYAWLAAGFRTSSVDLANETLVFRRASGAPPHASEMLEEAPAPFHADDMVDHVDHPIWGCMRGTVTIPPGVDLTEPADPDWGRRAYAARTA